jgi:hypothetical protein
MMNTSKSKAKPPEFWREQTELCKKLESLSKLLEDPDSVPLDRLGHDMDEELTHDLDSTLRTPYKETLEKHYISAVNDLGQNLLEVIS